MTVRKIIRLYLPAIALLFFACSGGSLYDPTAHQLARPFAFVTNQPACVFTFADTSTMRTLDSTGIRNSLLFVGLVSNPQPQIRVWWDFGDAHVDSTGVSAHSFAGAGMHLCRFSISDSLGNTLTDSVQVCVYSTPSVDFLLSPWDGQHEIDPAAGVRLQWHINGTVSIDTPFAQVLVGQNPDSLHVVASGIKSQEFLYAGPLNYSTNYYWQIILSTRFGGRDTSVTASFTTRAAPTSGPFISVMRPDTSVVESTLVQMYATANATDAAITEYA
jgi:hypothetical protein